MADINVKTLVEEKAIKLYSTRSGKLIGRDAGDNADEYPALESFAGSPEVKQEIVGQLGTMMDNYKEKYGEEVPVNRLAAAMGAVDGLSQKVTSMGLQNENLLATESVDPALTTQDNVVQILNIQNTIAMEYELRGILSQLATSFPSNVDETVLFELQRKATKKWGPVNAGDVLGIKFKGGLTELDPPLEFPGDATKTSFPLPAAHPVVKDMSVIFINYDPVGLEINGSFSGTKNIGGTDHVISGSYSDYETGTGTLTVTPALPVGAVVMIKRPLNLEDENGEKYIQGLKYDSTKRTVKPLENALDFTHTFHAGLKFQRNFKIDLFAYADKDSFKTFHVDKGYNALNEMYKASLFQPAATAVCADFNNDPDKSFKSTPPSGSGYTPGQHIRESLKNWLWLQEKEQQKISVYGTTSRIVGGDDFIRLLQFLTPADFRLDPFYVSSHDVVYYGKLFGKYQVFYDSREKIIPKDEGLCIATSNDSLFHNGYLNSTAIPLNSFNFQMTRLMRKHKRLWCRVYRRLDNPKYYRRFKIDLTS